MRRLRKEEQRRWHNTRIRELEAARDQACVERDAARSTAVLLEAECHRLQTASDGDNGTRINITTTGDLRNDEICEAIISKLADYSKRHAAGDGTGHRADLVAFDEEWTVANQALVDADKALHHARIISVSGIGREVLEAADRVKAAEVAALAAKQARDQVYNPETWLPASAWQAMREAGRLSPRLDRDARRVAAMADREEAIALSAARHAKVIDSISDEHAAITAKHIELKDMHYNSQRSHQITVQHAMSNYDKIIKAIDNEGEQT